MHQTLVKCKQEFAAEKSKKIIISGGNGVKSGITNEVMLKDLAH